MPSQDMKYDSDTTNGNQKTIVFINQYVTLLEMLKKVVLEWFYERFCRSWVKKLIVVPCAPSTIILLGSGLIGMDLYRRKQGNA